MMKEQNWQQNGCPMAHRNIPGSNNNFTTNEEEDHQLTYSFLNECRFLRTRQLVFDCHAGRRVARLREPANLYAVAAHFLLQPPRWPIECEVIREEVHHIEWSPAQPEKLYQPSGQENIPPSWGGEGKETVFAIDTASKAPYFTCSRVGGRRGPLSVANVGSSGKDPSTLIFESRFESGNLQKATRIHDHEYELTLRPDLYTERHTQWFYFRVRNMQPGLTYRFTIVNLSKGSSLYSRGLRPLLYSEVEARLNGRGWQRAGSDLHYYRNRLGQEGQNLSSLSWTCCFPHAGDTCYLAHSYPYTYSELLRYLNAVATHSLRSRYCSLRPLCRSLAGNPVPLLTITSPGRPGRPRPAIVLTARAHPGEAGGSWAMRGLLDHLLGPSEDARLLRDSFIFKVVPMLNPDGVVVGNSRCSLTGCDMNRLYGSPLRHECPSVWHTQDMVQRLMQEREVVMYCDFHGHSRKNNVFMYGCSGNQPSRRFEEMVFPLMMSKNTPDKFKQCLAEVHVVLWKVARQRLERLGREYGSDVALSDLSISDLESSTSGSNSTESDGPPTDLMRMAAKSFRKKKRLRSRRDRNWLRQHRPWARPPPPVPLRPPVASGKMGKESESPGSFEKAGSTGTTVVKVQLPHTHGDQHPKPRPWIPNTTSGLSVICGPKTKNKTAWLEAMSTAYLRRQLSTPAGQKYDQFVWGSGSSSCLPAPGPLQQRAACQRATLPLTIVDQQQEPCAPIQLHPLPFDTEVDCADTPRQCVTNNSWKPGDLFLRNLHSATMATLNRSLNAHSASSSRALTTRQQLASQPATPQQEGAKLMALPRPVTARMVIAAEPAGDHLHIRETTRQPQDLWSGTDTPSRKNFQASPDVSKMAEGNSGFSVLGSERGKRAPPVPLSIPTASLVSLDIALEQNEGVNNIDHGLDKVLPQLDPHPSASQTINSAVSHKTNKAQRLPKPLAKAITFLLPKVVSGTTVAMHQPIYGPSRTKQLMDTPATDGLRQVLSRKSPEMQEKPSEPERQRKMEQNVLKENPKGQLSSAGLWQESEQQLPSAKPPNTSAAI
ncbi:cytosolic carboxypeptidase 2 isoform X2 [Narcine bancroftii]|uniref:cytosolic carboxypeptidase 2 isoform X2 n=1 Tax=Narcine bancroftii TaxID=1343680 RepID=UPI0038313B65